MNLNHNIAEKRRLCYHKLKTKLIIKEKDYAIGINLRGGRIFSNL